MLLALVATGLRRSELIALDWGDLDTLRHTAATWLRQATGDARLVAEYLGHADLSTVSRYAHVAPAELHDAADAIAARAGLEAGSSVEASRHGGAARQQAVEDAAIG